MAARYRIKHNTEAGSYLVHNTGSLFFAFHYRYDKDLSQLTAHRAAINCAALLNAAADGAAIELREHVHRCLVELLPESYSAMLDLLSQFIPAPRKCKDCQHAQKCCGAYVLCTQFNYERRHINSKTCASFKPRKEQK